VQAIIVSVTLFATILLCLGLGILCGYAAVTGILNAFGHKPAKPAAELKTAVQMGSGD
jgi:hypothetical protein